MGWLIHLQWIWIWCTFINDEFFFSLQASFLWMVWSNLPCKWSLTISSWHTHLTTNAMLHWSVCHSNIGQCIPLSSAIAPSLKLIRFTLSHHSTTVTWLLWFFHHHCLVFNPSSDHCHWYLWLTYKSSYDSLSNVHLVDLINAKDNIQKMPVIFSSDIIFMSHRFVVE